MNSRNSSINLLKFGYYLRGGQNSRGKILEEVGEKFWEEHTQKMKAIKTVRNVMEVIQVITANNKRMSGSAVVKVEIVLSIIKT